MKIRFIFLILFCFSELIINAQLVHLTFKTKTANGSYAPKHVLAVWVEKQDGTFVKTLYIKAAARKQYLYSWKSKSGGSTVDAVTGSTISSHRQHDVYWNCRDLSGQIVPNGDYKIIVEFTEKHAQGPTKTIPFTLNGTLVSINDTNETYFQYSNFTYDPNAVGIEELSESDFISIYPNPSKNQIQIKLESTALQYGSLTITDLTGKILYKFENFNPLIDNKLQIDISSFKSGLYFVVYQAEGQIIRKKFLVE